MGEGDPADEDDLEPYASVWSLQEEPSLGSSWTPAFGCREANSWTEASTGTSPDDVYGLHFGVTI